ncbi:gluconate:H+ symporter, GntP family [Streptomyces sp. 2224.1]|uniref:GntP family permease n=1 Tax=unclassified Streptomyces TaxID=2593676 RepID=UPI0008835176|nr:MULTISPECIES: gluconate:H+ symporter [unclassified Streptomyces]PBC84776.1 GntP family gluconate:H+ symporter [Streptomyces sp. 2321.6]SDR26790.1 gluconate:H+ symporter, GntP family [Streptomyces sp. KS_16]SEB62423.1 gluconate:H+ symporter, GntP family [Streptomyces sp. 2224.1]SED44100.1 gluconate:H+ symporter, GntP family [Streptomyces sp. 2133.1]SEE42559.1 gluconate:H+ symporter, GntP family [Streptomyces sp. 2112.3]
MFLAATPATPPPPPHTGGLIALIPGTAGLLTVAALGIALLLVLIIKVRLQPFVALLTVSIAVGLAAGLSVTELFGTVQKSDAVSMIETGMGGILGHVAIIIGLGTMLGAILEVSGGAEVLSSRLLRLFGERREPLAMGLTGLIFGIPVFFDVGIFVLAPIVYAAAKRSGKSILLYCMPLLAGLSMTHAFLPPHPGPVAAAGLFKVDLGWIILMGILCGIPAVLAAWGYAAWIGKRLFVPVPQDMVEAADEAKAAVAAEKTAAGVRTDEAPVPLATVLTIIGTPLLLILLATFSSIAIAPSPGRSVIEFFGHPFVALTIALLMSYYLLGIRRGWSRKSLETVSTASLKPVGNIILVVGAGGIFGAVLKGSGVATALSDTFHHVGLPVIVLAYLLSLVLRVAQGSATVAIVTTAGIVVPLVEGQGLSQAQLALIIMAISAGSIFASHVNDGGFWMVSKYFGITERDTLKSWTVLESVLSVVGFAVAVLVSLVV